MHKQVFILLFTALLLVLFSAGCNNAPDYTDLSTADALLTELELTEADLLPSPDAVLTFQSAGSGTYRLFFASGNSSAEAFDSWAEGLREKTKVLDMAGYCRVVHNTLGIKDEELHDSHHCWYIAYSAEKSIKYLAYRTESGDFALKIQYDW